MPSAKANPQHDELNCLERPVNILLVDEDPVDLARYAEVLRRGGCAVTACGSYLKALNCLDERTFDLVLVTQGTDRFAWRSVVDSAAEPRRRTPVVVLTQHHDLVCHLEAMNLGAADYLEKPLAAPELLEVFLPYLRPAA